MNADSKERGVAKREEEGMVPSKAAYAPPARAHTPDEAPRGMDFSIREVAHGCDAGCVFEALLLNRCFGFCTQKPCWSNKSLGL